MAEGIETEAELACLIRLGVHFGQGYFLGRPQAPPAPLGEQTRLAIVRGASLAADGLKCASPINDLAEKPHQVAPGRAWPRSSSSSTPTRPSTPWPWSATAGPRACHEPTLDRLLSTPYGLALYLRREVSRVMDASPLAVEWDTPVEVAAQAAMARDREKLYDPILVTCRAG